MVDFLLGTVRLNTNADTGKYESTAYDIGFDLQSQFYLKDEWDKDIIIFDIDNNLASILILANEIISSWWRTSKWVIWYYNSRRYIFC